MPTKPAASSAPPRSAWRNRIVGTAEVSPDQLLAFPCNARIHPQAQQAALEGVLAEVGWVQDIIVNQRSAYVLDGHLRVALALRHGVPTVPVKYVDLDEAEERLVVATLDPIAAMAGYDTEILTSLLADVSTGQAAVQQLLSDLAARAGVVPPAGPAAPPPTEAVSPQETACPACGHRFVPEAA